MATWRTSATDGGARLMDGPKGEQEEMEVDVLGASGDPVGWG